MADVTLTYNGQNILEMSASGTKTLKAAGKICKTDIEVAYVKSGGGGGNGAIVPPEFQGLSYGYIISSGTAFYQDTNQNTYLQIYNVIADHTYLLAVGNTVGNRRRASFFAGKTISQFMPYLTTAAAQLTRIYSDGVWLAPFTQGADDRENALAGRILYTAPASGVILYSTDSAGNTCPAYCVDMTVAGTLRLQTKTVTPEASQQTVMPDSGYDGLSSVTVNGDADLVAGNIRNGVEIFGVTGTYGSGSASYPVFDAYFDGTLGKFFDGLSISGTVYPSGLSQSILDFMENYARHKGGTTKEGADMAITVALTFAITQESVSTFKSHFNPLTQAEYYGYVTSAMITALGLVELGRNVVENSASPTTLTLNDDITNYSAILIQGIYRQQINSNYNTTMMYIDPQTNTIYWGGMKDRNTTYNCYVTFTATDTAKLSGGDSQYGRECIIWGMP